MHEGTSNNGHYTSIVKDITKTWKYFDDKNVYNIDIAKLKKLSFGIDNDDAFIYENNSKAYLLFYIKKNDLYCEPFLKINSINLVKKYFINPLSFSNIFKTLHIATTLSGYGLCKVNSKG